MALFFLRKLILQTHMHSHPVGLDVWYLVGSFVYFHTSCVRTAKALARLRECAGSPEPSLVAYVISTIISSAGSILFSFCIQIWYLGLAVPRVIRKINQWYSLKNETKIIENASTYLQMIVNIVRISVNKIYISETSHDCLSVCMSVCTKVPKVGWKWSRKSED